MKSLPYRAFRVVLPAVALVLALSAVDADAVIPSLKQNTVNLTAKSDFVVTPDGGSYLMWGYSNADIPGRMQYPGPTIDVNEGDTVTINLTNELDVATSIIFPGHMGVTATGGNQGLFTREAPPDGATVVTYQFTASRPGTFIYQSGTRQELQIEMGLLGALIVRPTGFHPVSNKIAYGHADSQYDHEYLFLLTELDPDIHIAMEMYGSNYPIDNTDYWPVNWFINGRCAPDTMSPALTPLLPTQPYNCLPRMHPGERMLMRLIGGGRDLHPYHTHGNNFDLIARDAYLLSSDGGTSGADLMVSDFTQAVAPGATYDTIFQWTGHGMGWDIYGHTDANQPMVAGEDPNDHGKPIPVIFPDKKDLTFGAFWSGSPFLGAFGSLPPGQGGINLNGGFFYMWHSHNEKEMVNNDIFPGGIMTMLIIEHPDVPIP